MNVREISPETVGSLSHYVETALSLTLLTVWVIIAFQSKHIFPEGVTFVKRLGWPFFLLLKLFGKNMFAKKRTDEKHELEDLRYSSTSIINGVRQAGGT